ncbi:type VI secretion system protein TssL, long form [Paraburkholderia sp. B3]|uniref:type VI secretion system protein TssL, long form n=1 Tax=Paraburkholderia sp. B3 TaxID=3134791 RepID=UPI003981F921
MQQKVHLFGLVDGAASPANIQPLLEQSGAQFVSLYAGLPEAQLGPASLFLVRIESADAPWVADIPDVRLDSKQLIDSLRALLVEEFGTFQKLCEQANIRRDHMIGARYCLCTGLDEVIMQTDWGKGGEAGVAWNTDGLVTTFHEDREGGTKVYLLAARLLQEPDEHRDLLEVIYRILSLGFEGRYGHEKGGDQKHRMVRQRIYTELMSRRDPVPHDLSPNLKSTAPAKRQSFYDFPVWIMVTVLSLILLGMWGYFKYQLVTQADDIQKQIGDIARMTPPPAPTVLHLKTLLKDEIAAGTVSVDEDAHHSAVTFRGDSMFLPGGVAVNALMGPLIARIAAEIVRVPGKVTVLGYTDNQPIHSRQFTSNDALSAERATQVLQMLQTDGVPVSRLEAVGKGEADPVADNSTIQGRAQNRRVEINVAE